MREADLADDISADSRRATPNRNRLDAVLRVRNAWSGGRFAGAVESAQARAAGADAGALRDPRGARAAQNRVRRSRAAHPSPCPASRAPPRLLARARRCP